MATYVIGDVQGCLSPLTQLLDKIQFEPTQDELWFTGDLINRGPQSLETLRFVKNLGSSAKTVLGNHDLTLLAVYAGAQKSRPKDCFDELLKATDIDDLVFWLKSRPLLHFDDKTGSVVVHAGLLPQWDIEKARELAKETEALLTSEQFGDFMHQLFGDEPSLWRDDLHGWDKYRLTINAFTRMRYCRENGSLDLHAKGPLSQKPANCEAWFNMPDAKWKGDCDIYFGHWAALEGHCDINNVYAVDTGCVWGNKLTAICVESKKSYGISCDH